MNPTVAAEESFPKNTPAWLKRTLVVFLFAASIAGFTSSAFRLKKSADPFSAASDSQFKPGKVNPGGISNFAEKPDSGRRKSAAGDIICQGTMVLESGKALAMINGQTVAAGATVNDVKILEIANSYVLIEFNGETRRLKPGESFTPGKK